MEICTWSYKIEPAYECKSCIRIEHPQLQTGDLCAIFFSILPKSVHNEDEDAVYSGPGPSRAGGMEVVWDRIRDGGGRARGEAEVGGEGGGGELGAGE